MKKISRKPILTVLCGAALACLTCVIVEGVSRNDRLSEAEVLALREQYPVCGLESPALASTINVSLEESIANGTIQSFVYGEVVGDYRTYYMNINTGDEVADAKLESKGLLTWEFYEYTVNVMEDTEGVYQKGDIITIAGNAAFKNQKPELSDGMKIIVPIIENDTKENRNYWSEVGTYYVTNDGYAISAFDETSRLTRSALSGVKVDMLLDELSEMIK